MNQTITINRMPMRVWRRPRVNDIELTLNVPQQKAAEGSLSIENADGLDITDRLPMADFRARGADYFVPQALSEFVMRSASHRRLIRIPKGYRGESPAFITLRLEKASPLLPEELYIEAEEGAKAQLIIKYYGEDGLPCEHTGITRLNLARGSELQLVRVQALSREAKNTDAVEAVLDEGASLSLTLAELGSAQTNASCNVLLAGEKARLKLDVLYIGDGDRKLDMTYRAEHRAKKTEADIRSRGILHGTSHKVLRDTLDFIPGAAGSRGREEESVLLLGSKARNISVPLLLCGEHDVEGEHAATSGRLDEEMMFYIMSRGISREEARKLMAKASFSEIVEEIPDQQLREEIMAAVDASIDRGGEQA